VQEAYRSLLFLGRVSWRAIAANGDGGPGFWAPLAPSRAVTPEPSYRGRLAPSPTGALHLGNARTFLVAWLRAREAGGVLALRMEDIDGPRLKAGAAEGAIEDLRWLGFDWDEGPDRGGPHAPYVQTERRARYDEALGRLRARALVYPCTCTRREIEEASSAPHGRDGPPYPGTCRGRFLDAEHAMRETHRAPAWRFRAERERVFFEDAFAGPQSFEVDDFVVAKSGGDPAYQLAVVIDDAAMKIAEVVRGDDLLPSTSRQLLLYRALGLEPPRFLHVSLVIGADGRRLAKRHGDTTIASYRRSGVSAARIVGALARTLGIACGGEAMPRELIGKFDLAKVPRAPVVFESTLGPALGRIG
jgi:glutamyl-tRNA synthetase